MFGGKRCAILGGAGTIGCSLSRALLAEGAEVVVLDNLSQSVPANIPKEVEFRYFCTASQGIPTLAADFIFNLVGPTGPARVRAHPTHTILSNLNATMGVLQSAVQYGGRVMQASTAEVYGEPAVHPQPESYGGNADPTAPGACYYEAKRFGETLARAYYDEQRLDVGVARIFNTYGPYFGLQDERLVPRMILAALDGKPLVVHGDGMQTRSLCYVEDTVEGLMSLAAASGYFGPVNIGNPVEITVLEVAQAIRDIIGTRVQITLDRDHFTGPLRRCPDITEAREALGWEPRTSMRDGLTHTINYAEGLLHAGSRRATEGAGQTRAAGIARVARPILH